MRLIITGGLGHIGTGLLPKLNNFLKKNTRVFDKKEINQNIIKIFINIIKSFFKGL